MPRNLSRTLVLVLLLVAGRGLCASEPVGAAATPATPAQDNGFSIKERVLRMTEFLDTMLPGTLGKYNMTLHFTPKFSDLRDREFVRYPIELRYGATDRLELIGGVSPFGPNPINSGRDHRWGAGEARIGARYDLGMPVFFYDKATLSLDNRIPLGKPPIQLNDHYTHVRPGISLSRSLRSWRDTTFYTNLSYDRSVKLTTRNPPPPEVVRRHVVEIAPGILYKPGELGYFGEYRFRHFQEPTSWHLGHEIQIGTIWDVPLRRSAAWRLPGKWQAEIAYRVTTEEGHGVSSGISARVNWRTTLREVLNHVSSLTTPSP